MVTFELPGRPAKVENTIREETRNAVIVVVYRKFRTHLDLLSTPQSAGGKMSKRLGGIIIGCKYKTSSWHFNGLFKENFERI